MHKLIILSGPAGVGKSTIAKLLSKTLKAKLVHFDRIMTGLELGKKEGECNIPWKDISKQVG